MKLPFFAALSAVVCGAAFGAAARWLLALWLDTPDQPFSRATLSANWIGALLIGLAAGLADSLPDLPPYWKLWLITGLLGSLTTFSGFSLEIVTMLQQQRYSAAILTILLHLGGSLLFTAGGLFLVRLLHHPAV